eukprot:m.109933 g.109933  ORF g.109933 m.109933 type:complete len:882 (-) comp9212_c2_seq2:2744-5389(-)
MDPRKFGAPPYLPQKKEKKEGFGYNALEDKYLSHFITKPQMFNHLRKSGLITKKGFIRTDRDVKDMWRRREQHEEMAKSIGKETVKDVIERRKIEEIKAQQQREYEERAHKHRGIRETRERARNNDDAYKRASMVDGIGTDRLFVDSKAIALSNVDDGNEGDGNEGDGDGDSDDFFVATNSNSKSRRVQSARENRPTSSIQRRHRPKSSGSHATSLRNTIVSPYLSPPFKSSVNTRPKSGRSQPSRSATHVHPHNTQGGARDSFDDMSDDENERHGDRIGNDGYSDESSRSSTPPLPSDAMSDRPSHHSGNHHNSHQRHHQRATTAREKKAKSLQPKPTTTSEKRFGTYHPTEYNERRNATGNSVYQRSKHSKKKEERTHANNSAAIASSRSQKLNLNGSAYVRTLSRRQRTKQQPTMLFKYVHAKKSLTAPAYSDSPGELLMVKQQIAGSSVLIAKQYVEYGDKFSVVSRRLQDQGLGLTFLINGQVVAKMSACCEYKYNAGTFAGGVKSSGIVLVNVEHGQPCMRCQIQKRIEEEIGDSASLDNTTLGNDNESAIGHNTHSDASSLLDREDDFNSTKRRPSDTFALEKNDESEVNSESLFETQRRDELQQTLDDIVSGNDLKEEEEGGLRKEDRDGVANEDNNDDDDDDGGGDIDNTVKREKRLEHNLERGENLYIGAMKDGSEGSVDDGKGFVSSLPFSQLSTPTKSTRDDLQYLTTSAHKKYKVMKSGFARKLLDQVAFSSSELSFWLHDQQHRVKSGDMDISTEEMCLFVMEVGVSLGTAICNCKVVYGSPDNGQSNFEYVRIALTMQQVTRMSLHEGNFIQIKKPFSTMVDVKGVPTFYGITFICMRDMPSTDEVEVANCQADMLGVDSEIVEEI